MTKPTDGNCDHEYQQTMAIMRATDKQAPYVPRKTSPLRNNGDRFFDYSYDPDAMFRHKLIRPLIERLLPLVLDRVVEIKEAEKIENGCQTKVSYKPNEHKYKKALGLVLANLLNWEFSRFNEKINEERGLSHFSTLYLRAELRGGGDFGSIKNKVSSRRDGKSNYPLLKVIDALASLGYIALTDGYVGVASSMCPTWDFMRLYGELNEVVSYDQGCFVSLLPRVKVARIKSYDFIWIRKYVGLLKTKKVVPPVKGDNTFDKDSRYIERYRDFLEGFEFDFTPVKESDWNFVSFCPPYNIYRQFALDVTGRMPSYGGGRFYGVPWQSISKRGRETFRCRLNGQVTWESMIELDFPSHHPRLLYVMYGLAEEQAKIKDMYDVRDKYGRQYERSLVKHAVLCLIFSNSTQWLKQQLFNHLEKVLHIPYEDWVYKKEGTSYSFEKLRGVEVDEEEQVELRRLYEEFKADEKKWLMFRNAMKKAYAPIWKHMAGGAIWKDLQLIDSEITHFIHKACTKKGIPVLSVHDSYIVPQSHRGEVTQIAVDAYKKVLKEVRGVEVMDEHVPRLSSKPTNPPI